MHKQNGWCLSLKVCRESMRKWSGDTRILAIALLVFLFEWILIEPIRGLCDIHGLSISCWFFVFLFKDIQAIFYYFGILLLFCDAPFVDNQQMDVILRVGKKSWFRGKVLYIMIASCIYFVFVYVVSVIGFFPNVGFSLKWEQLINTLSIQQHNVIRREIVAAYLPLEAFFVQFVICVLFAIFLGLLIFYFNLYKNKNLGIGIALAMVLIDTVLSMVDLGTSRFLIYFIPMAWTDIEIFKRTSGGVPFAYAVTVLCIAIAALIALIMRKSKSYNIECQEDM